MSEQEFNRAPEEAAKKRGEIWWTIYVVTCFCYPVAAFGVSPITILFAFFFLPVGLSYDFSLIWTNLLNFFGATIQVIWLVDGWLFAGSLFFSYWIFIKLRQLFLRAADRRIFIRLVLALILVSIASLVGCAKMTHDPNWDPMPKQM